MVRRLHTPAGLKYGSYAMILGIITALIAMLLLVSISSIDFESVTEENVLEVLAGPLAILCALGILGIVVIIFYILLLYEMYVGRFEFGEKHRARVTAGLILIVFGIVFTVVTSLFGGGLGAGYSEDPETYTIDAADFRNEAILSSGLSIVGTLAETLGLVFFALELIGDKKKNLLWAALGLTVLASIIGVVAAVVMLPSEGALELQDVLKWSSYIGAASSISIIGTIVMLIAYRATRARILSGEILPVGLQPVQPPQQPPPAWGQQSPPDAWKEPPKWEELEPADEPEK